MSIKRPELLDPASRLFIAVLARPERAKRREQPENRELQPKAPRAAPHPRPAPRYKGSIGKRSSTTLSALAAHALSREPE
jgi:hypothetical protein